MEAVENFIKATDPWMEEVFFFIREHRLVTDVYDATTVRRTNVFIISYGGEGAYALQL